MEDFNNEEAVLTYLIPKGKGYQSALKYLTDYRNALLVSHSKFRDDIILEYKEVVKSAISDHCSKTINVPIDAVLSVVEELNLREYLEDDLL